MCMPLVPRLSVARESLPLLDPRFGLFSAATLVEDMDPLAQNGIQQIAVCEPGVAPYPYPQCPPGMANPPKEGTRSQSIVTADPFAIYAAEECPPLGVNNAEARTLLRERILMGEAHTVEAIVENGYVGARPLLRDPEATILNAGAQTPLAHAIGLLEQRLAAMGRPGVIHAPRWTAPVMDSLRVVHRSGARITTLLGTPLAFGSGYSGLGPYGQDSEGTWLFATATPTVYRSPIYEPGTLTNGAFDPSTNRMFLLAERVYVVSWPCGVLAIQTDLPLYADIVPLVPAPPMATLIVSPSSGDAPLEVSVYVNTFGNGPATVDMGDGSAPLTVPDGGSATYTYADPGTYTVSATVTGLPGPVTQTVTVRDDTPPTPNPTVTVLPASGPAPLAVEATVNNHGNGPTTVNWGDGSAPEPVADGASAQHTYTTPGSYTVTVASDASGAQGTATVTVSTPPAPAVTATPNTGTAPLDTSVTVNNHGNGPVTIDFGDGTATAANPGDGTTGTAHTYTASGTYTVTATSDASGAQGSAIVTVSAPAAPAVTATPNTGTAPLDTSVTVDNHGNGPVTIDFGDGTATAANPGDGTTGTAHTYTASGTYTVTATSDASGAQGTAAVTVSAAPPALTVTPESGVAPLAVSATVANGGAPATIDWGDGTATAANPGDGTTGTAHTYTAPGDYTAVATGDASGLNDSATVSVTAPPAPLISATPESGSAPLSVEVSVDNHGNGAVSVDFGDGSAATSVSDGGTAEHTYTTTGTFTVTASSEAFPSASATLQITVSAPADPVVAVTPATGPWPLDTSVTVDNHGNGPVTLDLGDGSPTVSNPGDGTTGTAHTYTAQGPFTVTATSDAFPAAQGTAAVTPTVQRPTITADPSSGPTPLLSDITIDNHGNGPLTVDFGDGNGPVEDITENEPWGVEYAPAGEYTITAASAADPTAISTATITVGPQADPVVTLNPTPATPLSVDIQVDNHGNGTVDVDFGDGQTGTHPGFNGQINEHQYASAGTYTVTATSQADPNAVGSAQITVTA